MTGTGPDPRAPTAEDHAFFQALETAFLRLRGKATLLSADDWQVAQGWHRAGVPVELAIRVMEELFERARGRRGRPISSLKYFRAAVESAWEEVAALSAGGRKDRLELLRVEERLRRLADSMAPDLPSRDELRGAILALSGDVPAVESALAELDRELLDRLAKALDPAERKEMEAAVSGTLAPLSSRLPPAELATASKHLMARRLRERHRLPVLSLFAPEARDPETAS